MKSRTSLRCFELRNIIGLEYIRFDERDMIFKNDNSLLRYLIWKQTDLISLNNACHIHVSSMYSSECNINVVMTSFHVLFSSEDERERIGVLQAIKIPSHTTVS